MVTIPFNAILNPPNNGLIDVLVLVRGPEGPLAPTE
ncbi:hypothetical protein FLWE109334_13990 [Flavobacterium weaverense]